MGCLDFRNALLCDNGGKGDGINNRLSRKMGQEALQEEDFLYRYETHHIIYDTISLADGDVFDEERG